MCRFWAGKLPDSRSCGCRKAEEVADGKQKKAFSSPCSVFESCLQSVLHCRVKIGIHFFCLPKIWTSKKNYFCKKKMPKGSCISGLSNFKTFPFQKAPRLPRSGLSGQRECCKKLPTGTLTRALRKPITLTFAFSPPG